MLEVWLHESSFILGVYNGLYVTYEINDYPLRYYPIHQDQLLEPTGWIYIGVL